MTDVPRHRAEAERGGDVAVRRDGAFGHGPHDRAHLLVEPRADDAARPVPGGIVAG